jgi:VWFA-related protein
MPRRIRAAVARLRASDRAHSNRAPLVSGLPVAVCALAAAFFIAPFVSPRAQTQSPAGSAPTGSAQSPASSPPAAPQAQEQPALELHETVRRVVVDVVATDAHGQPVTGLQASEFRVYEDGQEQTVRHFDAHTSSEVRNTFPRPPALPPHTFMNLPAATETGPITVILYDLLNTPLDAQLTAHQAILDFLRKNPERRQTAIFVLSDRLHLLQGFTSSQDELLAAANSKRAGSQRSTILVSPDDALQPSQSIADAGDGPAGATGAAPGKPTPGATGIGDPSAISLSPVDMLARAEALEASALLDLRVEDTLEALDQIARFLSGIPGRKNLIWLSGSFPVNVAPDPDAAFNGNDLVRSYGEKIKETGDLLNQSQVAVYPVDLRGVMVNPAFSAASRKTYAPGSGGRSGVPADVKAVQDFNARLASEHSSMDVIGQRTGGHAFYGTNALQDAMLAATVQGGNYYSLEYAPTNPRFDGSLRRIRVTLDRGGVQLAYRRSYFADDLESVANRNLDPTITPPQLGTLLSAMQFGAPPAHELIFAAHVDALGAPAPATPEQMQGLAPYLKVASRMGHKKFVMPEAPIQLQRYAVQYAVLASQLDLPSTRDNVYAPDLTFAILAFDEDGYTLSGIETTIQDAIPASRIAEVRLNGYRIIQMIYAPVNSSSLRIAVRDGRTNRIGSMEVHLPLPPLPPPAASAAPAAGGASPPTQH